MYVYTLLPKKLMLYILKVYFNYEKPYMPKAKLHVIELIMRFLRNHVIWKCLIYNHVYY